MGFTKHLLLKVPVGTDADKPFHALLVALMGLARHYDLGFAVDTGDCISPVGVFGDIELELAEEIKQRALVHVRAWETEKGAKA